MIPKETVDKILDSSKIEEVIGDFVTLKRRGSSFVACCPFHNEKTPSFHVSPAKGIFKCFGCGKSGSSVGFVMEHEGMSYYEALKYLAKKYGITVIEKEETEEDIFKRQRLDGLYTVSEFAERTFKQNLLKGEGRAVGYAYFKSRGINDASIKKFGLGWAEKSRTDIYNGALQAGFKEEYLIDTGLCIKNEDGQCFDRFFERVMFPIHSISGRVTGFGGRTLKSGHVSMKYVNTPTTDIYVKEKSLYGIWFAKNEIARQNKCYLVEGYLDVISMSQTGITNVVASGGTSLTSSQIGLIKKFTDNIVIMYDGDKAGINAAIRGVGLILHEGMNVSVVILPEDEDPDSFSQKHTKEEVEAYINENVKDFISFKVESGLAQSEGNPMKRAELIQDIADTIALIPDAIKRATFAEEARIKLNINPDIIYERINSTRLNNKDKFSYTEKQATEPEETESQTPAENKLLYPYENDIIRLILNHGLTKLLFNEDSDYHEDSGITVTDFINSYLSEYGFMLENKIFRRIYEKYIFLYEENCEMEQDDIVKCLLRDSDQNIVRSIINMTEPKHVLSLTNLQNSLTNTNTLLTTFVPKIIISYHIKRIDMQIMEKIQMLKTSAETNKLLSDIQKFNKIKQILEKKI